MKFLLTNDDGIEAPGLAALRDAVAPLGDVVVVAPHRHHSGCSHQATTHRGIEVERVSESTWAVDGTPVDCTRIGLLELATDADWVLSGVNDGGNLGVDILMSGTVAAAREAALLNKPAISLSQYRLGDQAIDWLGTSRSAARLIEMLCAEALEPSCFWNVNFPANRPTSPWRVCAVDPIPLPVEYREKEGLFHYSANYHARGQTPACDVDVCFGGDVAISIINALAGFQTPGNK